MLLTFPLPQFDDTDGVALGVNLVLNIVFGVVCAVMAPGRGRSAVGWFFIGFLLSCVGLIILLLIPDLKLEEQKQRRHSEETRRLREQLKKERQVADERHDVHSTRLGVHDRALGLDTSPTGQLGHAPVPPPLPSSAPKAPTWYYAHDGQRHGPVAAAELHDLWLDQRVPDTTLVWCEGMKDWRPIGEVDVLGGGNA